MSRGIEQPKNVAVVLPGPLLERVRQLAVRDDRPISSMLRRLIALGLDRLDGQSAA
jgi:hypothetical protein